MDGDAFFVSCELTRRPDLRGRAVVTGGDRGIATAMNQAVKVLGIGRGMRTRDIRSRFPQVVILSSDYLLYSLYASRMYSIVRRWSGTVEEYSIDECFTDLTGLDRTLGMSYEEITRTIQEELMSSLAITFSVGLSVNKVMAKIASKWQKPAGLTVIPRSRIDEYLRTLSIGKVWGIGSSTTISLRKLGIVTALDLVGKDHVWVAEHCDKPLTEIYQELRGNFVKPLSTGADDHDFASVQHTRSFYPPSHNKNMLWSELSHHVEEACRRLRMGGKLATEASFFLKTQTFEYLRCRVVFGEALAAPSEALRAIQPHFNKLFYVGLEYRAVGVTLSGLRTEGAVTGTLFVPDQKIVVAHEVGVTLDRLSRRFGRNAVFLGSSMKSLQKEGPVRRAKHFDLIYLGEVD